MNNRIQSGAYNINCYSVVVRDSPHVMDNCDICGGMYINVHILKENDDMFKARDICHKCTFKYKLDHKDLNKRKEGLSLLKMKGLI